MPFERSALCLLLALTGCRSASMPPETPSELASRRAEATQPSILEGRTTDLELVAGVPWREDFAVAVDSFLQVVVAQRSLDVGLRVVDSRGESVAVVDGAGGIGVDERLAASLAPGTYGLILEPRDHGEPRGRVRLTVEALRPAAGEDPERLRLIRLGQEATDLDGSDSQVDWQRAYNLSLEELAGWRRIGEVAGIVRTLNRIVSLERELGALEPSILHGEEAVGLSLAAGDDRAEAVSRYWLAQSLVRAGRSEEADAMFALGLEAAERAEDLALQGRLVNWQGRLSHRRGDLLQARRLYLRALELRRAAHDRRGLSPILNNLGIIEQEVGDLAAALRYFREGIAQAKLLAKPGAELLISSNLSSLLAARGQWQEALDSLTVGLEIARATDDPRREAILGTKLALLLLGLGEPEPARELLTRSLELDTERQDGFSQAIVLLGLAQVEKSLGNLPQAEARLLAARDLAGREELAVQTYQAVRGLATLRLEQQAPQAALALLQQLLADPDLAIQPIRHAGALRDLGETYLQLGAEDEALSHLGRALDALGGLPVPEIRFDISYLTAQAMHARGDDRAALREIEEALEWIESLRLSVDDPDLRATFLARSREAFDFAAARLLELARRHPDEGFAQRAFVILERARARSLVEMLNRARFGAEQALDPRLLEIERSALASEDQARRALGKASEEGRLDALPSLQTALEEAQAEVRLAEDEIRRTAPRYATLRYADGYSVQELQNELPTETALVAFSLQAERSAAFVVTRESFAVFELEAEDAIATLASSFRGALTAPNRRAYGALLRDARELGDLLIAPLEDALGSIRHLVLVPDGALAYIPFEALRVIEPETGEEIFLVERWVTSYAASAGVLRTLMRDAASPLRGSGLVAFADPQPPTARRLAAGAAAPLDLPRLPGARREVATITSRFGSTDATSYLGAAADEGTLKTSERVRGAKWIHLAAHALIDERTPANSAIVLAPSETEDGYLTVQEIFALDLAAELVVLSGCETALGRQIRGEGLIGLTRAFFYSGARGLQVSLWKVADDTAPELMSDFYANLASDLSPAEALRSSKLESLEDPRRSHPFHWAPFVFMGSQ